MNTSFSQNVGSTAYNLVLKTLLDSDVATISIDSAAHGNYQFVDARSIEEFEVSHIKSALWVGFDEYDAARLEGVSKDEQLVVYCSIGYRSEKITQKLKDEGYKNVLNLYGGIFEWVNQGQSVYKDGEKTTNVHAFNRTWGIWLNKGNKVY